MAIERVFAAIGVTDLDAASAWYARLLGRPPDATPMDGLVEWHFPGTGGLQLVRDADRAGHAALTLATDDLEQLIATLAGQGLVAGAITTGEKARFVAIGDPDGNTITLAETRGTGPVE